MANSDVSEFLIRECDPANAEAVLGLWQQAEATVSLTDTVADIQNAASASATCFFIAEVSGEIVGSIIGGLDGWRGNIYRLVVHPEYRRRCKVSNEYESSSA